MDQGATVGILVGEAAQNIDGRLEPNLVKQGPPPNQAGRPKPVQYPRRVFSRDVVTYLLLETSGTSSRAAELPHIERES